MGTRGDGGGDNKIEIVFIELVFLLILLKYFIFKFLKIREIFLRGKGSQTN